MKKIILPLIALFSLSLIQGKPSLHALTAEEIISRSEKAVRGNTQTALYEITIKTKRWTRTLVVKSWENRILKKSFAEILSPKKDSGNRFLLVDKNMQHYVPNLQRVIKISPSMMLQPWMGSDFTNDDIVKESSILEDYTHELIGNGNMDGQDCYKIRLTPKPDAAVVWGMIVYYARTNDYLPVRQEFYNEHAVLKKTLSLGNFRLMHGRIIPTLYRMQAVKKDDGYTEMEIKNASFNGHIPDNIFTLQNLEKK